MQNAAAPITAAGNVNVELVPLTFGWDNPIQVSQGTLTVSGQPPSPLEFSYAAASGYYQQQAATQQYATATTPGTS